MTIIMIPYWFGTSGQNHQEYLWQRFLILCSVSALPVTSNAILRHVIPLMICKRIQYSSNTSLDRRLTCALYSAANALISASISAIWATAVPSLSESSPPDGIPDNDGVVFCAVERNHALLLLKRSILFRSDFNSLRVILNTHVFEDRNFIRFFNFFKS